MTGVDPEVSMTITPSTQGALTKAEAAKAELEKTL